MVPIRPRDVADPAILEVRLLGPLEIRRGEEIVPLPRSKKTRALLAYLAATGRGHTRTHLCSLLWESTDDPRAALRWSLSKLRPVVNDETERLETDRQRVRLLTTTARIDASELSRAVAAGVSTLSTADLERLARLVRGELLEGFELADLYEFQAWCVGQREHAREAHCSVLAELVSRRKSSPRDALPYARALVRADALSVTGRQSLLELLVRAGKRSEAEQQFEIARRLFRELDAPGLPQLDAAWRALQENRDAPDDASPDRQPPSRPVDLSNQEATKLKRVAGSQELIGRRTELGRLSETLERARTHHRASIALVTGEPGIGKSHLESEIATLATSRGTAVMRGRAWDAERPRPFGPWTDALGQEIAELAAQELAGEPASRETLFQAVADAIAARAETPDGALLILDDIQWLDSDSADLLHFVVSHNASRPLAVMLFARAGELDDNEAAMRALRGLRRDLRIEKIELGNLSREEIGALVADVEGSDLDSVWEASGGNPLFALELARSGGVATSSSLALQVRERVDRLPAPAADLLRWGSVLGHAFEVSRLESLSALEPNELIAALDRLEHHALLRSETASSGVRYAFSHDVVREVVYGEMSQPRRRLMHRQVARLLAPDLPNSQAAAEVARHASLAGEALLGVRACITAGLAALRSFANADAEIMARRGLELAGDLDETDRISATLDLLHIQYSARTPDREAAASRVQPLAERALDLGLTREARLGFQMVSFLRWESSSLADAHDKIVLAERVSRLAEPEERATALANAARCFLLLERNMEQAEAFVMEADLLTRRGARATSVVPFATAMLHAHRGHTHEAIEGFREARWLGREQGDRLAEFRAVEQWTMLEIDRGRWDEARTLATELAALGERVRAGSEGPVGRALLSLVRIVRGDGHDGDPAAAFDESVADLRAADARYQLAYVLNRRAHEEIRNGDLASARQYLDEGLECASAIGRQSEIALSRALLARCLRDAGDPRTAATHLRALEEIPRDELSATARALVNEIVPSS